MNISRLAFLKTGLATIAAVGFGVGCSDDDSDDASGGGSSAGGNSSGGAATGGAATGGAATGGAATGGSGGAASGCGTTVAGNHGHAIEVTEADVAAGADKTYAIGGSSPHSHDVTVTAADFTTLSGGGSVMVTSSDALGHNHMVTVTCA